jgi:MSHA biogenesis protein MshL
MMKRSAIAAFCLVLSACANEPPRTQKVDAGIMAEMNKARASVPAPSQQPEEVNLALMPPLRAALPTSPAQPLEAKFDLVVSNGSAREIFMSLVSGTRYSMIVHPEVSGTLSVNLKDVTIREALEAIREVYGYEFKIDGTRIYIQPAGLQTRVFQVNYLTGARQGRSDMRVTSTSQGAAVGSTTSAVGTAAAIPNAAAGPPSLNPGAAGALSGSTAGANPEASRLSTVTLTDLWQEIAFSLRAIVGITSAAGNSPDGRSVIISPQSGVVVVRALPQELRSVDSYLKAMRVSVERQVMIEAKIIDVTLSESYQNGVNWAAFPTSGLAGGLSNSGNAVGVTGALSDGNFGGNPTARTIAAFGAGLAAGVSPAGAFGLAFQTNNFAAVLSFLESQGSVQVLSSPRIAATNNQKAVLKVGTDEIFVTNVTSSSISSTNALTGATTTTTRGVPTTGTLFSGISLDITPQIDDSGNITLHIHPLVSKVTEKNLVINFGDANQTFPVASNEVSESDTIVRAQDGNIVVLGGLMKVELRDNRGGIPGLNDAPGIGGLFRNNNRGTIKKELIILIKSTVIKSDKDWQQDIQDASDRMQNYGVVPPARPAAATR